jgi:DNA-directed RNA polymerase sigma subunit (sigma70/sigma32)
MNTSTKADPAVLTPVTLEAVIDARGISERAALELVYAIQSAAKRGYSLRAIGAAAGLSHEKVRQLLQPRPT